MQIPVINEIYLYVAFFCVIVAFFFYYRARKRRKKELEHRRSLSDRFRRKNKKNKVV